MDGWDGRVKWQAVTDMARPPLGGCMSAYALRVLWQARPRATYAVGFLGDRFLLRESCGVVEGIYEDLGHSLQLLAYTNDGESWTERAQKEKTK